VSSPARPMSPKPGIFSKIRSPQDTAAGLFLIALGLFAVWQSADLPGGTLNQMGPGKLPRALGTITALCGLALLVQSFRAGNTPLERWALRGPICILGAAVAFGLTVRPLGLALAGPLAVIIAGLASNETRWVEVIVFGAVMTAFCIGLFKAALGLPIPVAPWLIGY
jgi:putative tricarboxylic transport membrane protein